MWASEKFPNTLPNSHFCLSVFHPVGCRSTHPTQPRPVRFTLVVIPVFL
jgi:hypothetical protein